MKGSIEKGLLVSMGDIGGDVGQINGMLLLKKKVAARL